MKKIISCALLVSTLSANYSLADDAWKTATDLRAKCQISVPSDWTPTPMMKSELTSPDKKASLIFHGLADGQAFDDAKSTAKEYVPIGKIIEDSADHLTYTTPTKAHGKVALYSVVKTAGVAPCDVQITYDPSVEELAKKIVASLTNAK